MKPSYFSPIAVPTMEVSPSYMGNIYSNNISADAITILLLKVNTDKIGYVQGHMAILYIQCHPH